MQFRHWLALLAQYRLLIILAVLLGGVVALLASVFATPAYVSESRVAFMRAEGLSIRYMQTRVQALLSPVLAERVGVQLEPPLSANEVLDALDVRVLGQSDALSITAKDEYSSRAAAMANTIASEYVVYSREQILAESERAAEDMEFAISATAARIELLRAQAEAQPESFLVQMELDAALSGLEQLLDFRERILRELSTNAPVMSVIATATVSDVPASPGPLRVGLMGALAGLVLGIVASVTLKSLRQPIWSDSEIERALGAPVVARLPGQDSLQRDSEGFGHIGGNALDVLVANLDLITEQRDAKTMVVTSVAGERPANVAAGIAYSLAMAGKKTVLISTCRGSDSATARFLDRPDAVGLGDALSGTPLSECVRRWGSTALHVMGPGSATRPADDSTYAEMLQPLVTTLARWADRLVIEAPDPFVNPESGLMLATADIALVVVEADRSPRRPLEELGRLLRSASQLLTVSCVTGVDGRIAESRYGSVSGRRPRRDSAHSAPPSGSRHRVRETRTYPRRTRRH